MKLSFPLVSTFLWYVATANATGDNIDLAEVNRRAHASRSLSGTGVEEGDEFEGDIKPTCEQILASYGVEEVHKLVESGILDDSSCLDDDSRDLAITKHQYDLWNQIRVEDRYVIPWAFDSSFTDSSNRLVVENALSDLAAASGVVTFVPRNTQSHYINVLKGSGCWSYVGSVFSNKQDLSIGYGGGWTCATLGIIQHEFLHALGFWHEQSRPDRDDYVTINWENIDSQYQNNFDKMTTSDVNSQEVPYDYSSVMHYGETSFSNNGQKTIDARGNQVGLRGGPSTSDILQLRLMYQCTTGPRTLTDYTNNPCTDDCKCWLGATGCGTNDNACQGSLVCYDNQCANPTDSPTNQPTEKLDLPPTTSPTLNPTGSPSSFPTSVPTGNPTTSSPTISAVPTTNPTETPPTCAPTSQPTNTPTTSQPTNTPTDHPTLIPTTKPDEAECAECLGFLSNYEDADDSKAAEKECKKISNDKDVQKACKKVVKDVLKKGKNPVETCKDYGWCEESRVRARRTAECSEEPTNNPTDSPTLNPTSEPTSNPTPNPTNVPTDLPTRSPTVEPTATITNAPTSIADREPTNSPTLSPTLSPSEIPSGAPSGQPSSEPSQDPASTPSPTNSPTETRCTCSPTTQPTGNPTNSPTGNPTKRPTENPTLVPTNTPTLSPTDPLPDEEECADCTGFLSDYKPWQSKAAEKECKNIFNNKDMQKVCKKVVKDVLKKNQDPVETCKDYGWCEESRARARRTTECVCEGEPTSSPTDAPTPVTTSEPTIKRTSTPTVKQGDQPTSAPTIEDPPTCAPTSHPTGNPTKRPTENPTLVPTNTPTLSPTDPLPDDECADCTGFLSDYKPWQSKAAEKECKNIFNNKDMQKVCKKVVKDVLKKNQDPVETCKDYGWCEGSRARARRTTECEEGPTGSPVAQPTKAPTKNTPAPTIILEAPPTKSPTANPTNRPTANPTLSPTDPKPDDECADCTGFLSKYKSWQSKVAEKDCKKISKNKDVQKACKKVVKDVLKKGKKPVDTCKLYGWCESASNSKASNESTEKKDKKDKKKKKKL